MIALEPSAATAGLPSLSAPATMLPAPLQPRIPRGPARIIVLCDGTAQARNWVKTKLATPPNDPDAVDDWDRGDKSDKPRKSDADKDDSDPQSGDFFTNVALLAKIIAQSSGNSPSSPPTSPNPASNGAETKSPHATNAMPQIVFYQSGVGTGTGALQNLFDQGTGLSLGSKIEEAYGFIVDNYQPGDELFLFGFSRGAYTARCINGFINWCGILSKVEMTHFADIWAAYQHRDADKIRTETQAAEVLYTATLRYPSAESEALATSMYVWNLYNLPENKNMPEARRQELIAKRKDECTKRRQKTLVVPPQIKAIGVWDTVSALGLPGMFQDKEMIDFFDFYDPGLGSNVQFGFHALSLEEDRKDFLPTMWYQPPPAAASPTSGQGEFGVRGQFMRSKQVLKQCWFQGVHTDCGGGYQFHGLSDITLIWMVSQLVDKHILPDGTQTLGPLLNIDLGLLATILDRRREWAMQLPHHSRPTVNYQQARTVNQLEYHSSTMRRSVWASMGESGRTNETIHPSVVRGGRIDPDTHPAFAEVRRCKPEKLREMWDEASDWEGSLRPTEKLLYWPTRAPYPWIPGADCAMNPLISPLVVTGGWNIPELATHRARQLMIQAASQRAAAMADVDDDEHLPSRDAGVDVDDQPTDGWDEPSAVQPTNAVASNAVQQIAGLAALPHVDYPEIPAKELGENPVDATRHPRLHTLWQKTYNASAWPNALFVDVLNLAAVPTANLRQTAVQGWLWELGDKVAGYADDVKTQAIQAAMPDAPRTRKRRLQKKQHT